MNFVDDFVSMLNLSPSTPHDGGTVGVNQPYTKNQTQGTVPYGWLSLSQGDSFFGTIPVLGDFMSKLRGSKKTSSFVPNPVNGSGASTPTYRPMPPIVISPYDPGLNGGQGLAIVPVVKQKVNNPSGSALASYPYDPNQEVQFDPSTLTY